MQNAVFGNWQTTLIGFVAGFVNYFVQLGPNVPQTRAEWGHAAISAFLAALGIAAKSSWVGSKAAMVLLAGILTLGTQGCATMRALFSDVKTDPAIVGMTGWWFQVGLNTIPVPGASAIPLPSITIGRGTIFRVGVTEEAHVKTGEAVKIGQSSTPGASSFPDVVSDGSLSIDTKDSSKAIEAMQGVYSPAYERDKPKPAPTVSTPPITSPPLSQESPRLYFMDQNEGRPDERAVFPLSEGAEPLQLKIK